MAACLTCTGAGAAEAIACCDQPASRRKRSPNFFERALEVGASHGVDLVDWMACDDDLMRAIHVPTFRVAIGVVGRAVAVRRAVCPDVIFRPCDTQAVPQYEFRCRACGSTFVESRPMSASSEPASCPEGHDDTVRLLTLGGVTGRAQAPASGGGGCCGGGCCS